MRRAARRGGRGAPRGGLVAWLYELLIVPALDAGRENRFVAAAGSRRPAGWVPGLRAHSGLALLPPPAVRLWSMHDEASALQIKVPANVCSVQFR